MMRRTGEEQKYGLKLPWRLSLLKRKTYDNHGDRDRTYTAY
jgi:hypothetical protein